MKNAEKIIKNLVSQYSKIEKSLDIEKKEDRLKSLEAESTDPKLWDDHEKAREIMQELGDLKNEIEEVKSLEEDINLVNEMKSEEKDDLGDELGKLKKRIETLRLNSLLSDEYDRKDAIISIHAGQGGTEAMDWASMLYRMYSRYCESRNWKTKLIEVSEGDEAGIKKVTFAVQGSYAYGYLKGEIGTHRLVRQSPFNADKLRHTSFALVGVLPKLDEVDLPNVEIGDEDLDWQFFRASSKGGQNVQKVSTAVRLTHKPTGIVVTAQTERYQEQNRNIALSLLRGKLWVLEKEKQKKEVAGIKGDYRPASWGNQIRSYVLHPYKMVKDLRTKVETSNAESVLDGNLNEFIEAELSL